VTPICLMPAKALGRQGKQVAAALDDLFDAIAHLHGVDLEDLGAEAERFGGHGVVLHW